MKKLLLFFVLLITGAIHAQSDFYETLSFDGSTSGNGRAPQGARTFNRSVWLITASEMTAAGFVTGNVINSLGFLYTTAQNVATTSTSHTVYMQNSTDATNLKSTTWATAITGMTTVSNANITIPATTGVVNFPFSGGTSFVYSGGSIYVAFDYQNSGTVASVANGAGCQTALTGGILSGMSTNTTAPTSLTASAFRPHTILGKSVSCARPTLVTPSGETLTSINLGWAGTGTVFNIEYGPQNFTLGTGTTINNFSGLSTSITGLTASSTYDFYVKTVCGAGSTSAWKWYPYYTTFQPTNAPYTTSFENYDFPYIGWSIPSTPTTVSSNWEIGNYGAGTLVQNGVYSVVSITPASVAADNWMFSRGINLVAGQLVTVSFYINNYQNGTTATGNYQLTVGNSNTVASQTTTLGTENGITTAGFVQKTFTFTPTSAGVYYFGLRNNSALNAAGTHALIVDNLSVTQTLSVDEFLNSNFSVSPNPANDFITVSNSENIFVNAISITDLNGRVVKQNSFSNLSNVQVNISDLSSGVYMINISSDKGSVTKKIIKN
jgi:hypothetical protein